MKLIQNIFLKITVFVSLVFVVWGVFFYFSIFNEVIDETDDILKKKKTLIIKQILNDPEMIRDNDGAILSYTVTPLPDKKGKVSFKDKFYNSTRYVDMEDEDEPVRVLETVFKMDDGKYYQLRLMISTLEQEDLTEAIVLYTFIMYILFLIVTFIGTRIILKRSFTPIYRLLDWLNSIVPGKAVPQLANPTSVSEYNELNSAAFKMAVKSEKAFQSQKEFIENASHELQTPLAIAMGKLEMMIEDDNLNDIQAEHVGEIYETLNRTVKLNKSLLLLMKIDNGQSGDMTDVSFNALAESVTGDLSEIYSYKDINLKNDYEGEFICHCNRDLAVILISNLIKNAFIHTPPEGEITISISDKRIEVINRDPENKPLDRNTMFSRFNNNRFASNSNSFGLGLSISKSIADLFGLSLEYSYLSGFHHFIITKKLNRSGNSN